MFTFIDVQIFEIEAKYVLEIFMNFKKRIFTSFEINVCEKRANKINCFAKRFAAKEALFKAVGIRTSLFVEAEPKYIVGAKETQTDRIELFTESYARQYVKLKEKAVKPFVESAILAKELGLGINAGHDLNLQNLKYFASSVPFLEEVSIGHALISDALYLGLEKTIQCYKNCLRK